MPPVFTTWKQRLIVDYHNPRHNNHDPANSYCERLLGKTPLEGVHYNCNTNAGYGNVGNRIFPRLPSLQSSNANALMTVRVHDEPSPRIAPQH